MLKLNGETINVTRFPDNTTQVWKLPEEVFQGDMATIEWDYSYEGELIELAQLTDLLRANGVIDINLWIEYLPFARQDKEISNHTTFALHSFATLLNSLEFTKVYINDPHSRVAIHLINNSYGHYPAILVQNAMKETNTNLICYPDLGALEKYTYAYRAITQVYIYGIKVRDQETGYISGYELQGAQHCEGKNILIVDDICDGGKTFEILSKDLYAAGAREVNLFVTHGIFSKGLYPLFKAGIARIFTKKGEVITMSDGGILYKNS